MPLLEALLAPLSRSQSAETLTVLLGSLSSVFKQLLGSTTLRLEKTWSALVSTLTRCNPEVRRAVAEVWASVLRWCKGETRAVVVTLILRDLETISDSGAWMFIYAFKVRYMYYSRLFPPCELIVMLGQQSVAHTLHTCTPALFKELLAVHLSAQHHSHTQLLLIRVITALIHHCNNAEEFSPVSDILVSRYVDATPEEQPYAMTLLSTACSVRKGSRMSRT